MHTFDDDPESRRGATVELLRLLGKLVLKS